MPFTGKLFPFQEEAAEFMLEHRKVLLAYEMGLGKTPITISVIEELFDTGEVGCGLVVTLASLKYQWAKEIAKFSEAALVQVIDGTPAQRTEQYERAEAGEFDYIVLNYEQVVKDWDRVRKLPRDFVVCDEVTAIKSFKAKRSRRVKRLQAPYLYGLSGQPIENKPEEAFSIMQWVDQDVLGRYDTFDRTFVVRNGYGGVVRYKNLPTFRKAIEASMVRKKRTDPDVRDQLPSVFEESYLIEFDRSGASLYRYITRLLLVDLAEAMGSFGSFDLFSHYNAGSGGSKAEMAARGKIMSKLTCLRMLCDHPELLRLSAQRYEGGAPAPGLETAPGGAVSGSAGGSAFAADLAAAGKLVTSLDTPKFMECHRLLHDLLDADPANKVVVFSFFKPTLRMLGNAMGTRTGWVEFTGDMNAKQKDAAKTRFQTDPECRLFLSSDAGGYGVDLPDANYLINYNLPWSAGKLDQRNARIVRLSSEFEQVTVINLLMLGSIEERQYDMLAQKRLVASAFIDGTGFDAKGRLDLSLATLTEFLTTSSV